MHLSTLVGTACMNVMYFLPWVMFWLIDCVLGGGVCLVVCFYVFEIGLSLVAGCSGSWFPGSMF